METLCSFKGNLKKQKKPIENIVAPTKGGKVCENFKEL